MWFQKNCLERVPPEKKHVPVSLILFYKDCKLLLQIAKSWQFSFAPTVVDKKTPHLLELFLPWSYLCEFLRLRWKIGIIGEGRSWTLTWSVCLFLFSFISKISMCFWNWYFIFTIKTNTLPHIIFQIFFIYTKFEWWRLFCKKFLEKIYSF